MATRIQILPTTLFVDGFEVQILESIKTPLPPNRTIYHVVVSINYKGVKSKPYTLQVSDERDLVRKLRIEITKLKLVELEYGIETVRDIIT